MNGYETKINRALVIDPPLFSSVWMALYNELRKNFLERHVTTDTDTENLNTRTEK